MMISDQIKKNRPAFFDWLVLTISFSLGFIFPVLGKFVMSPEFSWWMLGTLVLYVTGVLLKHQPLSQRLFFSKKGKREIGYTLFLVAGHWCIFLMVIFFSAPAAIRLLGLPPATADNLNNGWFIFFSMFLTSLITWLVFRSKIPSNRTNKASAGYLFRRELVADILLVSAVSFLSFVLWEKGVMALLSKKPVSSFSEVWIIFIFLSFAYLLCYLPLRYLFLLEDHSSRQTWRRMLLIFGFLLLRSVFEIIGF